MAIGLDLTNKPKEGTKERYVSDNSVGNAGAVLTGAAQGASVGSVGGPIGAVIGAVMGAARAGITQPIEEKKALGEEYDAIKAAEEEQKKMERDAAADARASARAAPRLTLPKASVYASSDSYGSTLPDPMVTRWDAYKGGA